MALKKIIFILIFNSLALFAGELKNMVKNDNFLSNGFVGFLEFQQDSYLIAVGISKIQNNTIKAKINAIKSAKALAQSKLTKFIYDVNIKSVEEFINIQTTIKDSNSTKRVIKRKYIEIIKEKSGGVLKKIINIGKWKIKDEYFYALGILIDE